MFGIRIITESAFKNLIEIIQSKTLDETIKHENEVLRKNLRLVEGELEEAEKRIEFLKKELDSIDLKTRTTVRLYDALRDIFMRIINEERQVD